jgi:hypothetical protein
MTHYYRGLLAFSGAGTKVIILVYETMDSLDVEDYRAAIVSRGFLGI